MCIMMLTFLTLRFIGSLPHRRQGLDLNFVKSCMIVIFKQISSSFATSLASWKGDVHLVEPAEISPVMLLLVMSLLVVVLPLIIFVEFIDIFILSILDIVLVAVVGGEGRLNPVLRCRDEWSVVCVMLLMLGFV